MSRLAISHYICPDGYPVRRFIEEAAEVGAGAVALSVRAVEDTPLQELKSMLGDAGLKVSSLNSAGYLTHTDRYAWEKQDGLNRRLVETAAELEAGVLCVITGGFAAAGGTIDAARALIGERIAELTEFASARNVRLGLEPIHPAEVMRKGSVNTIADARRVIEPLRGIGLILDHFHSWWDPDLRAAFSDHLADISLLQFCNLCEPSEGGPLRRGAPSDGGVSPTGLIRHAEARGYRGWYEFEIFPDSLRRRPVAKLLREAAAMLDSVLPQK